MKDETVIPAQIGRYLIKEKIGQGGTADIYHASAPGEPRDVALKVARRDGSPEEQADWIEQIRQEAAILTWLSGTGIPAFYGSFEADGYHCNILEYIDGQSLDEYFASMAAPLPERDAIQWGLTICEVLLRLHNREPQPYIYRFIAPDNLMRDRHGQLYVLDYGKVAPYDPNREYPRLGVIGYSAPELYVGRPEPRSDVFGLGVLLYHATTRRDPRQPNGAFLFHVMPPRSLNPSLTQAFEAVILRAVEHNAAHRYPTVAAMQTALRECL